jgi:hypothetical protein
MAYSDYLRPSYLSAQNFEGGELTVATTTPVTFPQDNGTESLPRLCLVMTDGRGLILNQRNLAFCASRTASEADLVGKTLTIERQALSEAYQGHTHSLVITAMS